MSSNLTLLDQRLIELETDIGLAEKSHAAASLSLASSPTDSATIGRSRTASQHLANLRGDAKLLRDARAHAEEELATEEAKERRREAAGHKKRAEDMVKRRNAQALKIDKALAALKATLLDWTAVNAELVDEVAIFYKLARSGVRIPEHLYGFSRDTPGAIMNALACQLADATRDLPTSNTMVFNFVQDRAYELELVAKDTERSGNRIMDLISSFAYAEGVE